jgi:excisionase family DNA binding protein
MTTTTIPFLTLGAAGAIETIDRIAAGAPILFTWPADGPLRSFLAKVLAWQADPAVTVGELYNLVYGPQNPLLSVDPETQVATVTRAAHADPAWLVCQEAIDRKRAAAGHLDLTLAVARFDMPVTEAAALLERTPSAIRQLIHAGRLVARKDGDSWLLDRDSVAAFRGKRRGPIARAAAELEGESDLRARVTALRDRTGWTIDRCHEAITTRSPDEIEALLTAAPVEVRIGHDGGHHVRIKGAQIAPTATEAVLGGWVLSGPLDSGWTRLHVLAYDNAGKARLFVFEPDPEGGHVAWQYAGFYVRGPAREVEHENNPRLARERFDALPK